MDQKAGSDLDRKLSIDKQVYRLQSFGQAYHAVYVPYFNTMLGF